MTKKKEPELTPKTGGQKIIGFLTKTPRRSRTLLFIVIGLVVVAMISAIF